MKTIFRLILGIALVFAQQSLMPVFLRSVTVDLVLIFIVFTALRRPAWETVLWGGLLGFSMDLFSPTHTGAMLLGYASCGFLLGNSRTTFNLDRPLLHGLVILFLSILQKLMYWAFTGFVIQGFAIYVGISIATAFATAILALLLDFGIRALHSKIPFEIKSE